MSAQLSGREAFKCGCAPVVWEPLGYNFSELEVSKSKRGRFIGTWGEVNGHQTWSRMVFSGDVNLSEKT
ncbi:MAG: hypothetical protein PHF76_10865 [Bacteroidales bacterium]|nr:hypothetical protein [Bacteroidales bacterium]